MADLAEHGVKEVTLLGQNVNAYRGTVDGASEPVDFACLLEHVAEVPGIERIRYTTSHPKEFTQRLIDVYARLPKLVSHVHLPVQAGSDRVLAAMKRGYTVLEYKSIVRRLRQVRPDISISSDFIVGFPGETETDFDKYVGAGGRESALTPRSRSSTAGGRARRPRTCPTTRRMTSSSRGCSVCSGW